MRFPHFPEKEKTSKWKLVEHCYNMLEISILNRNNIKGAI